MENKAAPIQVTISKNYDSAFCGSIPLHLVNMVQPHGVLLTLSKGEFKIVQASENVTQFLCKTIEEILEKPISDFLPAAQYQDMVAKMSQLDNHDRIPFLLTFSGEKPQHYTAIIHPRDAYILIELEPVSAEDITTSFIRLYQQTKYITTLLKQAQSTADTAQIAVDKIKELTGFHRVLVYQFDPQWNGIVIAQAKEPDMEDFMDLRFPASDVPKQARDLYFRNPYRLIPTRNYVPVRLLPVINPITLKFTDLSDCNLRSVAVVHLEYLGNMGVDASMSLPIIIDNKLWGLISCHHQAEKNPGYEMRASLELLSDIVASQLAAKEREKSIIRLADLSKVHAALLKNLYNTPSFIDGLVTGEQTILDLLNISGVAVFFDGTVRTAGITPDTQELKELVAWLRRNNINKVYHTDQLEVAFARKAAFTATASGLIVIPIQTEREEFILGFRPEVQQTIKWGGNPDNAIQLEPDGKTYHPRNSFATYMQTIKQTSSPWLPEEIVAAENLRNAVLEKMIKER